MSRHRRQRQLLMRAIVPAALAMVTSQAPAIPAFPGAEGFGANSVGGRGGDVYHVTTLQADPTHSIPGSLEYGAYYQRVPAAGRTIVFDVGGVIDLGASSMDLKEMHNLTIAGQTAPSPIIVTNNTTQITGNNTARPTHDIIMRYMTFRKGTGAGDDAMHIQGTGGTRDIIVDHISGSWSEDEVISVTQTATNVTVQYSMMSEALTSSHAYGALIRPTVDSNVTYSHNLFSNQKSRNPRPGTYDGKTLNFEFQNNVVYNWSDRAGYIAGADGTIQLVNMNYVGNYLVAGPVTSGSTSRSTAFIKEVNADPLGIKVWQEQNKIDSTAGVTRDGVDTGWNMFKVLNGGTYSAFDPADENASRFSFPMSNPQSSNDAYARVIASVGAFPQARTATDTRLVNDVLNYTGFAPVTAPPADEWNAILATPQTNRPAGFDTDNDGMPNYWETLRGTNPAAADNNGQLSGDGYTNLENYINSQTFIANWTADADGFWSDALNWRGGVADLNDLTQMRLSTANFVASNSAPRTVVVDRPVTVSDLNFDSPNTYTIAGNNPVTMDAVSGRATVSVINGAHNIASPMALADDTIFTATGNASLFVAGDLTATGKTITKEGGGFVAFRNVRAAGLQINAGGVAIAANGGNAGASQVQTLNIAGGANAVAMLDLADNDMIVGTGTGRATIEAQIAFARHGGAWDQPGLSSSAAATNAQHSTTLGVLSGAEYSSVGGDGTFDGLTYGPADTLIKYTYYGDTDFNGLINFDDYSRTDAGFNSNRSGWLNGDFDSSGTVNFDDYALIDLAFNVQSSSLRRAMAYVDGSDRSTRGMDSPALQMVMRHASEFGLSYQQSFLNAVPEPTAAMFGLIALTGFVSARRRRGRRCGI